MKASWRALSHGVFAVNCESLSALRDRIGRLERLVSCIDRQRAFLVLGDPVEVSHDPKTPTFSRGTPNHFRRNSSTVRYG